MSRKLILLHIVLNISAIILLFAGLYYAIIKPENWFFKHRACMFTATFIIFLSIFYALYIKEYQFDKRDKKSTIHGLVGIFLGMLLLFQVFIAIMYRKELGSNYLIIHRIGATLIVCLLLVQIYLGYNSYKNLKTD